MSTPDLKTPRLLVRKEGPLGFIVFNHPERHNAMSTDMWEALPRAVETLDADPEVRAVILTGAGEQAFVSGADISEFEATRSSVDAERRYAALTGGAVDCLQVITKPTLAMIRGFCIGGGLAIALVCDLRIAAEDARLGIPAARLGLSYSFNGVRTLTRIVGPAHASDILFTGRQLGAPEALRIGLVSRVVPVAELEAQVRTVAMAIADNAPLTVRASKRAIYEVLQDAETRNLATLDCQLEACFDSEDYAEGRRAFRERRKPRFQGR